MQYSSRMTHLVNRDNLACLPEPVGFWPEDPHLQVGKL